MDALFAEIDNVEPLIHLCLGCAGVSVLFLVGLTVVLTVRAIRKDNEPPTDP